MYFGHLVPECALQTAVVQKKKTVGGKLNTRKVQPVSMFLGIEEGMNARVETAQTTQSTCSLFLAPLVLGRGSIHWK